MKLRMNTWVAILLCFGLSLGIGTLSTAPPAFSADQTTDPMTALIQRVEERYQKADFSVYFTQASTLKAMEITETATGRLWARDPGKMRWEYETPEPQLIITDGTNLWIHRPLDNQVMIGQSPTLFGSGKGAGFLADIQSLKSSFMISLAPETDGPHPVLKLVPQKETPDLAAAYLTIDPSSGEVVRIRSLNHYEDETRIDLSNYDFDTTLSDALFQFQIPEEADVLRLDE